MKRTRAQREATLKTLAKGFTVLCVRNTIIEKYHADGKLSQEEMKAFNIEVCDKVYEALCALLGRDEKALEDFVSCVDLWQPHDWQEPKNKGCFSFKGVDCGA